MHATDRPVLRAGVAVPAVDRPGLSSKRPHAGLRSVCVAGLLAGCAAPEPMAERTEGLAGRVEIRRTEYGVPHLLAEDEAALGFGLAWCQLEDYGERVIRGLVEARGEAALHFGREQLEADVRRVLRHRRAQATYAQLDADVRAIMEGFAAGVNAYIEAHREELPGWAAPEFTGVDVAARVVAQPAWGTAGSFLRRLGVESGMPEEPVDPEAGSNAWALAPSRTTSGHAILLRNPHLRWTAGYYEAHLTIPGRLDFYGDVRIGGPLEMVAGFNEHLGWATTNNNPVLAEVYELRAARDRPDHYLFDGEAVPLRREAVTVGFRDGEGAGEETREVWFTPLGPVVHRDGDRIYALRTAGEGEFRLAQQFLRMMQARDLREWQAAVRMRAKPSSNLTYADRDGNIYYVWNASVPVMPAGTGRGAGGSIRAAGAEDVWQELLPYEALPQLLNPAGGYVRNENDPPYFTNLREPVRRADFPPNFPPMRLRLRSQHSLELIDNERRFSLEDVCELKHSMRALLADRVKGDLLAAAEAADPGPELQPVLAMLRGWDNTVSAASRGSVLFDIWWRRYTRQVGGAARAYAEPWSPERPMHGPRGLADPVAAVAALREAVPEAAARYGSWDVAWGDVHRVRLGDLDLPVGGGAGALGCFRVLNFRQDADGRRVASGGDGWVLAVEFGPVPRAYSVLAYGQSPDPASPHHADQAALFAAGRMKPVAFTEADIRARLLSAYRPGH